MAVHEVHNCNRPQMPCIKKYTNENCKGKIMRRTDTAKRTRKKVRDEVKRSVISKWCTSQGRENKPREEEKEKKWKRETSKCIFTFLSDFRIFPIFLVGTAQYVYKFCFYFVLLVSCRLAVVSIFWIGFFFNAHFSSVSISLFSSFFFIQTG